MKNKAKNIIPYILFLLALIPVLIVSRCTTLYGDDFIYATYFSDGFSEFISKTINHYNQMNGRALVHFILELILIFKDKFFVVFIPLFLILTFYLYSKICQKEKAIELTTISLMLLMCLSPAILREGILWMAGYMNYVLPTLLAFLSLYLLKNDKTKPIYLILAFICGATTEQGGAMAVSSMVIYIFASLIKKESISKKSFLLPLFAFLGYLTVVLSPATSGRTTLEATETVSLIKRFENLFYIAFSKDGATWLFELTLLLISAKLYKREKAMSIAGFIAMAVSIVAYFYQAYIICGLAVTLAFLYIGFSLLFKGLYIEQVSIGLSGLLSAGMLLLSTTFGFRNLIPLYLTLICLSVNIFLSYVPKDTYTKTIAALLVFAISLICGLPTVKGYMNNRKIVNQNISAVSNEDEGFYYNVDLIPEYSYNQFITDNFYRDAYRKIYDVNEETKIFLKGKDFTDLRINGVHLEYPMYTEDKKNFFPLRDVIEAYGGELSYNIETKEIIIEINEKKVSYKRDEMKFSDGTDAVGHTPETRKYGKMFDETNYFTSEIFLKVFDISI